MKLKSILYCVLQNFIRRLRNERWFQGKLSWCSDSTIDEALITVFSKKANWYHVCLKNKLVFKVANDYTSYEIVLLEKIYINWDTDLLKKFRFKSFQLPGVKSWTRACKDRVSLIDSNRNQVWFRGPMHDQLSLWESLANQAISVVGSYAASVVHVWKVQGQKTSCVFCP